MAAGSIPRVYHLRTYPRKISAAPYRDRIVHHALCNVIEPIFDRCFIHDSQACRTGKGTHAALERFTRFAQQSRYVLKTDIRKYFPSIDRQRLKIKIRRKIKCHETLALTDLIIDRSNPQDEVIHHFPGDDLFTPCQRTLKEPSYELERLKLSIRLATDLRLFSLQQYEHCSRMLTEVGKLLGGWMKKV